MTISRRLSFSSSLRSFSIASCSAMASAMSASNWSMVLPSSPSSFSLTFWMISLEPAIRMSMAVIGSWNLTVLVMSCIAHVGLADAAIAASRSSRFMPGLSVSVRDRVPRPSTCI